METPLLDEKFHHLTQILHKDCGRMNISKPYIGHIDGLVKVLLRPYSGKIVAVYRQYTGLIEATGDLPIF